MTRRRRRRRRRSEEVGFIAVRHPDVSFGTATVVLKKKKITVRSEVVRERGRRSCEHGVLVSPEHTTLMWNIDGCSHSVWCTSPFPGRCCNTSTLASMTSQNPRRQTYRYRWRSSMIHSCYCSGTTNLGSSSSHRGCCRYCLYVTSVRTEPVPSAGSPSMRHVRSSPRPLLRRVSCRKASHRGKPHRRAIYIFLPCEFVPFGIVVRRLWKKGLRRCCCCCCCVVVPFRGLFKFNTRICGFS